MLDITLVQSALSTYKGIIESVVAYLIGNWISLLALAVSAFVLYLEHLRSFRLKVGLGGRISITKNPLSPDESALVVDLILSNAGSRNGVIEIIAIAVKSDQFSNFYAAHLEFEDRSLSLGATLAPPVLVPFVSFQLAKREAVSKRILFRSVSGGPDVLPTGSYRADIWAVASNTKSWRKVASMQFAVDSFDVGELREIRATPQPDGRFYVNWKTRDKLIKSYEDRLEELRKRLLKSA